MSDTYDGTSQIRVHYLGCGHISWDPVPVIPPPRVTWCRTCNISDAVVMSWECRQVEDGPAMRDEVDDDQESESHVAEFEKFVRDNWLRDDVPPCGDPGCQAAIHDV